MPENRYQRFYHVGLYDYLNDDERAKRHIKDMYFVKKELNLLHLFDAFVLFKWHRTFDDYLISGEKVMNVVFENHYQKKHLKFLNNGPLGGYWSRSKPCSWQTYLNIDLKLNKYQITNRKLSTTPNWCNYLKIPLVWKP